MTECDTNNFLECEWIQWLWRTTPVIHLFFGTFGNILNVVILCRRRMKGYSTTVYLIFLAFADMVTLWTTAFPRMLRDGYGIDIRAKAQIICMSLNWINHTSAGLSIWLLVLLTAERMLLAKLPIFARSKLNWKSSLTAAIIVLTVNIGMSSHFPFGRTIKIGQVKRDNVSRFEPICAYRSASYRAFQTKLWSFVVLLALNVLPMILIIVGNNILVVTLLNQRKKFMKINPSQMVHKSSMYRKGSSSAKLIFLISAMYICTTVSYTINRVIRWQRGPADAREEAKRSLVETCLYLFMLCNFTFNFLLYFVSGTMFKQEFRALVSETRTKFQYIWQTTETSTLTL